jgi:hypothetical protein
LNNPTISEDDESCPSAWIPHKLYLLAYKLSVPELMETIMVRWVKMDSSYEHYPHFNMTDEVYSTLLAGSLPRKYVSGVMYSITRQQYKNPLLPGKKMRKMMEKHPDLKADFSEYLEEDNAQAQEHNKRFKRIEEKKAARALECQAEERDTGIDPRACNEAFAG